MTPTAIVLMVLVVLLIVALPFTWKTAIARKKSREDAEKIGQPRRRQEVLLTMRSRRLKPKNVNLFSK